jgi:hypothetical protein
MSKLICMAIPVLPGKEEACRKFGETLSGSRSAEFKASRKKLNVRERAFYQQTPHGDLVIVTLEGDDPVKAFQNFATAGDEFTKWFTTTVKENHGLDLTQPPPGPMPVLMVDSDA